MLSSLVAKFSFLWTAFPLTNQHSRLWKEVIRPCEIPAWSSFRKNATSLYQPLDQGIIRNTKVHYRRHWMKYILNLTMDGKDPIAEVTLLHALWWFTEAWLKEVKPETIANCWWKSAILGERRESTSNSNDWDDAFGEILQMAEAMNVQDTEEELADFINPAEEQVEDIEDQLAHLAEVYSEVTLPEGGTR